MAGTERDGPTDDDAGAFDETGGESDTIDGVDALDVGDAGQAAQAGSADVEADQETDEDSGGGLLSRIRGGGETEAEADVQEDVDEDGAGVLDRVRGALGGDEDSGPSRAQLVDGANVLFVDPAAKSKSLYEYDLTLITAPQYPEPIVLKNDVPIEIPEGSVLCAAKSASMIDYGGKRVIARAYILVPPERADEVAPEYLEDVPEALQGKTIPQRSVQDEEFYQLILNGVAASATE